MKIPVEEFPDVNPAPLPNARVSLDFRGAFGQQMGQALQSVGQNVARATEGMAEAYKEEKAKADKSQNDLAMTGLEKAGNDGLAKLQTMRGEAAMAAADGYYKDLKKAWDDGAAKLTNDSQRRMYQEQAQRYWLSITGQAEHYVGQQSVVAKQDRKDARKSEGLRAVAAAPDNDKVAAETLANITDSVRGTQESKEGGDNEIATFRGTLASTRIQTLMGMASSPKTPAGAKDAYLAKAQELFDADRAVMGEHGIALGRDLNNIRTGLQSDTQAAQIVSGANFNRAEAHAKVDAMAPGLLKDETAKRVDHLLDRHVEDQTAEAKQRMTEVLDIYNNNGKNPFDPQILKLKGWLTDKNNGPEAGVLWNNFEREIRAEARSRRYEDREDKSAEARRQRGLYEDFMAHPASERASMDVQQAYLGQKADQTTINQMRAQQQKDNDAQRKDAGVKPAEFEHEVGEALINAGITDKRRTTQAKAYLNSWFAETRGKDGAPPTLDEVKKAISTALTKQASGHWYSPDKYPFQATTPQDATASPQQQAAPAQKQIRGWRFTKDRKQKAPVYTDGTTGPLGPAGG